MNNLNPNLLKTVLRLKGFDIYSAELELAKNRELAEIDYHKFIESKRNKIFNHHLANNRFYENFVKKRTFVNWEDVPVMSKASFQIPLSKRLSRGYNKANVHYHNTSGSTGNPFYFAKDPFCHALSWAINFNRFAWHDIDYGADLQARFYGIPSRGLPRKKEQLKDFLSHRKRFPVFDLSESKLESFLNRFRKSKFVYANGYTSSLVQLAKFCIARNTTVSSICPSLKAVVPTSEVCDSIDRKILTEGFGVPVINEYGCAELDLIAFEDKKENWLINHETLHVEILDDNNFPVPPGEEGRVVITSLYNKAMPFIRYDVGDRAVLDEMKVGSYRKMKIVKGRTNDFALLPSGKKASGLSFYYIAKELFSSEHFMKEFIIVQETKHHFILQYVATRELTVEEKDRLTKAIVNYLEEGLEISFSRKQIIQRSAAGKLKSFISLVNE